MARKRMIDPGIWTNIQVTRLSVLQRLLYIGLISNADDDGRLNGDPLYLKGIIFPHDNITPQAIEDQLKAIAKQSLIVRYKAPGGRYIYHPNWSIWQKIDRPTPSKLPPPNGSSPSPRRVLPESSPPTQHNITEKNTKQQNTTQTKQIGDVASKGFKVLLSVGVGMDVASKLAATYDENTIMCAVRYARDNNVKNPAGYVVSCLRKGYV